MNNVIIECKKFKYIEENMIYRSIVQTAILQLNMKYKLDENLYE